MRKIIALWITVIMTYCAQNASAQGTPLVNNQGVKLSYTINEYKNCGDDNKKCKVYQVIAYVSNNSGKTIRLTEAIVSHLNSFNMSERDCGCCSCLQNAADEIHWIWNDPNGYWKQFGTPMKDNTTISGTYYFYCKADIKPPIPYYRLGEFVFIDDKPKPEPQWSDWITDNCFKGISYRYKKVELYNLNYQLHFYFEIKS